MIVESMTHEEVYQELEREREAVTRWWRHQLDDQRRRALKCTRFPMHIWKEYTSPRKNRYLFFSRVFDKHMKIILTGTAVIRHTSDGMTVYTTWLSDQKLISPMVLLPHMWKRYQDPERGNGTKVFVVPFATYIPSSKLWWRDLIPPERAKHYDEVTK